MKKYIYVLLVVLILGVIGLGCDSGIKEREGEKEIVVGEGKIVSYRVYDVHEMDNQAYCDVVLKTESNDTQTFSQLLVTFRTLPEPIDSNKVYKVTKSNNSFGRIWYKISEK